MSDWKPICYGNGWRDETSRKGDMCARCWFNVSCEHLCEDWKFQMQEDGYDPKEVE